MRVIASASLGPLALVALMARAALAQSAAPPPPPPPPPPPASAPPAAAAFVEYPRRGLLLGFGLGGGNISADCAPGVGFDCDQILESGSFDFRVGWMLSQRLGIMFDGWGLIHHDGFLTITHTIATAAVQYWLVPRLWVKGGIGAAWARFHYDGPFVDDSVRTDHVPGGMLGVGYEVLLRHSFAMDVQLRAGTGVYGDDEVRAHNVSLGLGFNWY